MKIRERKPISCIHCGGPHPGDECRTPIASPAPLETPSHNGPWQGKIPVREIPEGETGRDEFASRDVLRKSARGGARRKALATLNRLETMCKYCTNRPRGRYVKGPFCSDRCRWRYEKRNYGRKAKAKKAEITDTGEE